MPIHQIEVSYRCKQSKHPNARFPGWFPSNSNVFSTVAFRSLNAPIVQGRARSSLARESSGSVSR